MAAIFGFSVDAGRLDTGQPAIPRTADATVCFFPVPGGAGEFPAGTYPSDFSEAHGPGIVVYRCTCDTKAELLESPWALTGTPVAVGEVGYRLGTILLGFQAPRTVIVGLYVVPGGDAALIAERDLVERLLTAP